MLATMVTSNSNKSSTMKRLRPCNNTVLDLQLYILSHHCHGILEQQCNLFWYDFSFLFCVDLFVCDARLDAWFFLFCSWLVCLFSKPILLYYSGSPNNSTLHIQLFSHLSVANEYCHQIYTHLHFSLFIFTFFFSFHDSWRCIGCVP